MSIAENVAAALKNNKDAAEDIALDENLSEAARLADKFADVKAETYVVPIERVTKTFFHFKVNKPPAK